MSLANCSDNSRCQSLWNAWPRAALWLCSGRGVTVIAAIHQPDTQTLSLTSLTRSSHVIGCHGCISRVCKRHNSGTGIICSDMFDVWVASRFGQWLGPRLHNMLSWLASPCQCCLQVEALILRFQRVWLSTAVGGGAGFVGLTAKLADSGGFHRCALQAGASSTAARCAVSRSNFTPDSDGFCAMMEAKLVYWFHIRPTLIICYLNGTHPLPTQLVSQGFINLGLALQMIQSCTRNAWISSDSMERQPLLSLGSNIEALRSMESTSFTSPVQYPLSHGTTVPKYSQ